MATEKIKDVPKERVQEIVESFEREGCTVETIEQDDGNYTIIAKCPDN